MLSSAFLILAILHYIPQSRAEIYRLPRSVLPTRYELRLDTRFAEGNFTFHGEVWIDLDVEETTSDIVLHSQELNIFKETIKIKNICGTKSTNLGNHLQHCCSNVKKRIVGEINATREKKGIVNKQLANETEVAKSYTSESTFINVTEDSSRNILILNLSHPLQQGCKYQLYIKYSGKLSGRLSGFYTYSYEDLKENKIKWLASTTFEPLRARRAFPSWDEPGFKAHFLVSLARPKNLTAISNMPLKLTTAAEREGWVWDHFEQTPTMSTYLLAFFLGDFTATSCTNCSSHFRAWTRAHLAEQTHFALDIGPQLLAYFNDLLELPCPLPKHDLLALPTFASNALENWGLISFDEKYILYKGASPITTQEKIVQTLSHELAHTWFGNLVSPKWWSDIWLNEGFATYFAALGVDHMKPEWDFLSMTAVDIYITLLSMDSHQSTTPLRPVLNENEEVIQIFNRISYYKGYFLLRMLAHTLGEDTFLSGIRSYIKRYAYAAVTQDDLWATLTEQAHKNGVLQENVHLIKLMNGWTNQEGYPTLNVTRDYDKGSANITQFRWTRMGKPTEDNLWWIPVTYTEQGDSDFSATAPKFWLGHRNKTVQNITNSNKWIIFNIQAAGLYRVNYDVHNWRLITKFLLTSTEFEDISVLNRALLLDDALNLARDGLLSYEVALNLTKYLSREQHYLPWKAALHNLKYLSSMLHLTQGEKLFQEYVLKLIEPQLQRLGFDARENDTLSQSLQREQILQWACQADHPICIDGTIKIFKHWKSDPKRINMIPEDLRPVVYCTAIKNGNENEWGFLRQHLDLTTHISERTSIIKALGCSRNTKILERFLNETNMKRIDYLNVFKAVAMNRAGFSVAKKFFFSNLEKIRKQFGSSSLFLFKYLESVTKKMNLSSDLQELHELQQKHAWLQTSGHSTVQIEEMIKYEKNYNSIYSWLQG